MTVTMIQSAEAMRDMVGASPEKWQQEAHALWEPMAGIYFFIPGGPDLAAVHRQNFGFGPDAPPQEVLDAIQSLDDADAWGRIERALVAGLGDLATANPAMMMPDLNVLVIVGDPTNPHFMEEIRGLSAFGGISGYIAITLWPTDEVLGRLEGIALHELHHNVRYSPGGVVWNPQTVTVGEHVVAEGLADLFASQRCGDQGFTHFVSEETRASDDVLRGVVDGLDVTGMEDFAAWVLGDASATAFGIQPVGLPTGAGYAAGVRLAKAYLEATHQTAAQAVATPAADILAVALPELGLSESQD